MNLAPIVIDGRPGVVAYLNDRFEMVAPEEATSAKVVFSDGGRAFYEVNQSRTARDYVRDKDGQFSSTGGSLESRVAKAIATHKPCTRAIQLEAAKSEKLVAAAVDGKDLPDHEPMDVVGRKFGIEVKTLVDNSHNKITMHPESRRRKEAWVEEHNLVGHTVVVDRRGPRVAFYHKVGFGAFRINSMTRVTLAQLRDLVR